MGIKMYSERHDGRSGLLIALDYAETLEEPKSAHAIIHMYERACPRCEVNVVDEQRVAPGGLCLFCAELLAEEAEREGDLFPEEPAGLTRLLPS